MCLEVFKILRIAKSLELIMASYQLLDELDKVLGLRFSYLSFSFINSFYISIHSSVQSSNECSLWMPACVSLEIDFPSCTFVECG